MGRNVRVKLNMSGLNQVMTSSGVQNLTDKVADGVLGRVGDKHFERRNPKTRWTSISVVGPKTKDYVGRTRTLEGELLKAVRYVK